MVDYLLIQIMDRMNTRRGMDEPQKFLNKNMAELFSLPVKITANDIYEVFGWRTIAVRPSLRSSTNQE